MADQTIDKVQLELKATSQGATEVISGLVTQLNALKSVLSSLDTSKLKTATQGATKVGIDTSGVTKSEKEIMNSVDKIKKAFAGMTAYKDAGLLGDKSSLVSAQRRLVALQSMADVLGEQLRQAGDKRLGVNIDTDQMQAFRTELADLEEAIKGAKGEVDSAVKDMNGKKIKPNSDDGKKDMDDLASRAKKAAASIAQLADKDIAKGFKNLRSSISKIRSALSSISEKATKGVRTGFMKILRYGFGIRSLYVLFRRLKEAIKDSFGALQSSGAMFEETRANINSLKNALLTLKFQFGAAFEPIFNAIAPALQTLINYLISVMNTISAFTAKLMGRSTYSKVAQVMSKTGSAAGGAAKNVKELNHQLQGFDELNNLTVNPGNSGGGGGGGAGGGAGAMYEEASVDSVLGDFAKELAENIRAGKWFEVGRAISDKLSEVMESIPWDKIYEKARNFGKGLADFLNGLITPELFGDIGITIGGALNTAFEVLHSFGETFDWVNFGTSIGTGITKFFETADTKMYGDTVHDWITGILDAGMALLENSDFELIGQKVGGFFESLQLDDIIEKLKELANMVPGKLSNFFDGFKQNTSETTQLVLGLSAILATLALTKNIPLTITLAAVLGGIWFGGKLYEILSGNKVDQSFFSEINDIVNGIFKDRPISFNWADAIKFVWDDLTGGHDSNTSGLEQGFRSFVMAMINPLTNMKLIPINIYKLITWDFSPTDKGANIVNKIISWITPILNPLAGMNLVVLQAKKMIKIQGKDKFLKELKQLGQDIIGGIIEGIKGFVRISSPIYAFYDWLVANIKEAFGIASPAKKMYPLGENILAGIVKGFKNAIKKYVPDALIELYEYFNGGGTTTEKQGYTAPGNFKNGSSKTHNKTGQKVTINTQYTGDIKGKNGLKDAVAYWTQLMDGITDKDSKLESSMLGAFTSVETVKEGADNFRALDRDFRSKNATYTTNMGGQITSKDQIDSVRTQYENLYNAWNGKASRFDVNTGGQLDKFGTLDTWRTKFTNLFNSWLGKSATMSANVGGQMNKIGDTDTWVGKIKNLFNNWVGRTANFNAGFNQTQGTIAGYADQMSRLYGSWQGRSADFTVNASFNADDINSIADRLIHRIRKGLEGTVPVRFGASGGIFTPQGKLNIPQYAGGTLNAGSMFIAGESGPEIVGEVNGRTEVLNRSQIAATIKAATVSGMRLFRGSQMVRPPELDNQSASMSAYGYEIKSQMAANNDAIFEQNRLLQEQNTLLREIANKELTVSTKDVFDATKKEAKNYYNRTGNSPFLY